MFTTTLQSNPPAVNSGFVLPADPGFSVSPSALPGHFLKPSAYEPDSPEHRWWRATRLLLPEKRQKHIWSCRKYASHLEKTTQRGQVDFVTPIGCTDRVACPFCAWHYAKAQVTEVTHKLQAVTDSADTSCLEIVGEALIPNWESALRTQWCDRAEERGRPCSAQNC